MYGERIEIEAKIETLAPLHIGTALAEIRAAGGDEDAEIAEIQKDARNRPIIPGSSLKGALRALSRSAGVGDGAIKELFGEPLDDEADRLAVRGQKSPSAPFARSGRPGRVTVFASTLTTPGHMSRRQEAERLGFEEDKDGDVDYGYVVARTAIDGSSGTADANKLFKAEVVAAGAEFRLRLDFSGGIYDFEGAAGDALVRTLAALTRPEGIAIGRGKSDGAGRIRLVGAPHAIVFDRATAIGIANGTVQSTNVMPDGRRLADRLRERVIAATATRAATQSWRIDLASREPFLVKLEKPKIDPKAGDKGKDNRLVAMRDGDGRPELPGSSFMGALRARADWFLKLARKRGEDVSRFAALGAPDGQPTDPIERLFGPTAEAVRERRRRDRAYTGWAGLLRLVSVTNTDATVTRPKELASVRIDRFSAEPFGGGLFFVEAFVEPSFRVVLELDPARTTTAGDAAFVSALIEWMSGDGPGRGIDLGHGVNRGFGWFGVSVVEGRGA